MNESSTLSRNRCQFQAIFFQWQLERCLPCHDLPDLIRSDVICVLTLLPLQYCVTGSY